jgi:hypothetical protein
MAIEYGTIAIVPKGEWDSGTQYEVANLVTRDGSSFLAHTKPPVGTLPTNTAYWQVSAQGTSKATAGSVGTVKPDGVTTEVSADGTLSAKIATQSTAGMAKGSTGITVGTGGALDVNTAFTQATELANIIAGEAIAQVLGKISKSIAVTMGLDQNALLKNMLTNIDANDQNKIPTAAFIHTLYDRIGMGTSLTAGANLTAVVELLNSNLTVVSNKFLLNSKYFAAKQVGFSNTNGNDWVNVSLSQMSITGKKLSDICAPMACISWNTGNGFWVVYCAKYDDTTLQVRFNVPIPSAFRVTLMFDLIDA